MSTTSVGTGGRGVAAANANELVFLPIKAVLLADTQPSSEVMPGVMIGAAVDAAKIRRKNSDGIGRVLSLVQSPFCRDLDVYLGMDHIIELHVPGLDWEHLEPCFEKAFEFIDEALRINRKVLIHCANGECRSVGLFIAYLIKRIGMSYDEAIGYMRVKYPKMDLSDSIEKGLKVYAESLTGS